MWVCVSVFLLWAGTGGCTEKANTSDLVELTAADFHEKLYSGKMMFVYFEHQVSPTISLFLVELEKSAEALQDYGVLVGKVNCNKELVHTYCTEEKLLQTAFLFRAGKEFLAFDLDTVFDVNSIVSEVLFAILRDEVKYVHTDGDLLAMEKAARGKKDIVLGYVRSLGTQEHRSMMETAYVYGSKYQFILITGGPVLKQLSVNEVSHSSSRVWFLHCRVHSGLIATERCPLTPMSKPLSTLSLHSFLQLMEAPLVSEVYDDPSSVPAPQFPYHQTPQVFLFSRPATEHLDRATADTLAWRLRGLALLLLVHRQSPKVRTPEEYNAAYRLPEKSPEVKYLTLNDLGEVLELFTNQDKEEEEDEDDEDNYGLEDEEEYTQFGPLDDEIAASVYKDRGNSPDTDSVTHLTSDNFRATVAQSSLTVALFYLKWDAVSMAFFSSFIEVAERLAESKVQVCAVDCGEWTDLCAAQSRGPAPAPFPPITAFPSVLLLRPGQPAQRYSGMLGTDALHRFIVLSAAASPALLSTEEEVTRFLQDGPGSELAGSSPDRVLGLFNTQAHAGVSVFTEAAESLRGTVLTGLLTDGLAQLWAARHTVDLPTLLVFPSWDTHHRPSTLPLSTSARELRSHIKAALLHPLPELTVDSLPSLLSLGKALLLLFVGEEEDEVGRRQNQALLHQMRGVVESGGRSMESYLACWIHLGRTPAGMSVLGSYLGSMPPLPALVLSHMPSGGGVYQYPPNTPIVAPSVLRWLQGIQDGTETPAGTLSEDSWPPAVDFYDFLEVMDLQEPDLAQQQTPAHRQDEREENVEEEVTESSFRSPSTDNSPKTHSEL